MAKVARRSCLKRLSDAVRDGNRVLAVVKGSAVNQDGRSNGITAPNSDAQEALIRKALDNAATSADEISYVEAHGTGTSLGDPIEINALLQALAVDESPASPCLIGAVKTNIGHLEAAAGIASLIKVVLAIEHGQIPAHLHLESINPHINLEDTRFSIPTELTPWQPASGTRTAGVSSFGFGGTNVHVVLQEAPPVQTAAPVPKQHRQVLALSAKTPEALVELAQDYQTDLSNKPATELEDVCFTANAGRAHHRHRLAVCGNTHDELHKQLDAFVAGKHPHGMYAGAAPANGAPRVAFLFSGQGSQCAGMGRQLYDALPAFQGEPGSLRADSAAAFGPSVAVGSVWRRRRRVANRQHGVHTTRVVRVGILVGQCVSRPGESNPRQ